MRQRGLRLWICGLLAVVLALGPVGALAQVHLPDAATGDVSVPHRAHHAAPVDDLSLDDASACSGCGECDGCQHGVVCKHCQACGHVQVSLTVTGPDAPVPVGQRLPGISPNPILPIPTRIPRPPRV